MCGEAVHRAVVTLMTQCQRQYPRYNKKIDGFIVEKDGGLFYALEFKQHVSVVDRPKKAKAKKHNRAASR